MADASRAISLYAIRMRVARLDSSGAPLPGPDNLLVTDSMVRVDYELTFTETDAITKPNGRGGTCLNLPPRRTISGATMTIELCEDDYPLWELLGGGSVLTDGAGADVIGYQDPKSTDPTPHGVSVEVWTEAYAGQGRVSDRPYVWTPFPKCVLAQTSRSHGAELDEKSFTGTAVENAAWGNGPGNDWTHDSTAVAQRIRTAVAPPAVTDGYAVLGADAP